MAVCAKTGTGRRGGSGGSSAIGGAAAGGTGARTIGVGSCGGDSGTFRIGGAGAATGSGKGCTRRTGGSGSFSATGTGGAAGMVSGSGGGTTAGAGLGGGVANGAASVRRRSQCSSSRLNDATWVCNSTWRRLSCSSSKRSCSVMAGLPQRAQWRCQSVGLYAVAGAWACASAHTSRQRHTIRPSPKAMTTIRARPAQSAVVRLQANICFAFMGRTVTRATDGTVID